MASPKRITIKETMDELKLLYRKANPFLAPRIRVLIEIKKHESDGISKREVASIVGVNPNSVQTWRKIYETKGIVGLLSHKKTGFKPSVFTEAEHAAIEKKLNDSRNGLRGYIELKHWVEKEFKKQVKYNTLLKYSMRKFGSKVKVARKSHVKKDVEAVSAFKKTFGRSVKKRLQRKKISTTK